MPIDRSVGAAYADRIITLYVEVERELAALIAAKLKRGVAHDDLTQRMLALSEIRRSAEAAMRKIDGKTGPAVELALREAAAAGGRKAQEELLRVRDRRAVGRRLADVDKNLVNSPSILRLAASLSPGLESRLQATHLQVVRSAGDIYQHAVAAMSVPGVLAGVVTRREATQKALDHLWRKGITGFVDKAGRNWNLASYVEMATRTTTAHAAIQAHLDQLGQQGMDLVMVSADGAPCPICRPWEGKILTTGSASGAQTIERASELDGSPVKVHIDGSTSEAIAAGLFHPSCFVGDTLVSSSSAIRAVDRRWYEGELVIVHTASGQKLTGTPNHPILTPKGWVPLGTLNVGQHVLRSTVGVKRKNATGSGMSPNDHEIPARISDVFDTLRQAGGMTSVRVPASTEQFHGDGGDGYVDVVLADRLLGDGAQSGVFDSVDQQHFVTGSAGQSGLSRGGASSQGSRIGDATADSIVRGGDLSSAPLCTHGRPFAGLSLTAADLSVTRLNPPMDAGLTDAEQGRQLVLTLAGSVEIDQIVNIERRQAACHVYNLQTVDGFYAASRVIVHNCRHRFVTYLPGLTAPIETAGEGGALYQAEQQQRGLERQARRLAVQQAAAVDPDAARRYAAAYRAKRAEIKAHVDDHPGLRRKTERERIDLGHAPSAVRPVTPTPKVVAPKRVPKTSVSKPVEIVKPIAPATLTPKELSREDLNRIYAGRFKVDGARKDPARLEAQLKDLGAIDERLHERMSKFMSGYTHGGIYVGPGGVLSSAPYALRANYEGPVRGWPAGSTWDDVGGCYSPSSGALIIAESKHELGGRHSTAQHEFGHAVDHMAKEVSSSDEYKKLYHDISGHIAFTPYYSQTGNPTGHLSESFAEFFNAYAAARGKSEASMVKAMLTQLGTPLRGTNNIAYAIIKGSAEEARLDPLDRQLLASVRHLIKIFDEIHEGKR